MGTQKLLLPFAGRTVVEHIVTQLQAAYLGGIIVVTGKDREGVEQAVGPLNVTTVHNAGYAEGMLTSVRAGLRAVPESVEAALVALGDQPALQTSTVQTLIDQFAGDIAVPAFNGRRGHPLLLSLEYRDAILTRYDDVGLRGLMQDHAVQEIPINSESIFRDMDYPEDYQRELRALDNQS